MGLTTTQLRAKAELFLMQKSLRTWLQYRDLVDQAVQDGKIDKTSRDLNTERQLASQLYTLLIEAGDTENIPDPGDPNAAVTMARYILDPTTCVAVPTNTAQGAWEPWTWGVLIVVSGLVLIEIAGTVRNLADNATQQELIDCQRAGMCMPDAGMGITTYLALGGAAYLAYWYFYKRKKHA